MAAEPEDMQALVRLEEGLARWKRPNPYEPGATMGFETVGEEMMQIPTFDE